MELDDVKVIVGNKTYPARTVNWIQTPGDYPFIEVEASISPYNYASMYSSRSRTSSRTPTIKNIIFNPPATIVFWSDNTKTVVKCDESYESYDPEKGLAMAISKKLMGDNKFEYYNTFLHWLKKWDKKHPDMQATKTEETVQEPDESASSIECRWDPGFSL